MLITHMLIFLSVIVSATVWAYSTLMVMWVILEDAESMYARPMRPAMDRFADTFYLSWLKPLHELELEERKPISLGMFGLVTISISLLIWMIEG